MASQIALDQMGLDVRGHRSFQQFASIHCLKLIAENSAKNE